MFNADTYEDWRGIDVVEDGGGNIGQVIEVFLDSDTDVPEWVLVDVGTASGGAVLGRLVPLAGLTFGETALVSRWTREEIASSPVDGSVDGISRSEEDRLYRHYGLDYPTHWINDGMPGGAETIGTAGIAVEAGHPSGAPGRSPDASASEAEVDEPRRVRRAASEADG